MSVALSAILASSLSSLLGLTGGFLLLTNYGGIKKWSAIFVSFAAGTLLGAAFLSLLPEAIKEFPNSVTATFSWLLVGFLLFFLLEKYLIWHHHGHGHEQDNPSHPHRVYPSLIIIGDAIHNFIDGMVIAVSFLVSPALGVTTATAVLAHELPQEIGDFSILIHGGMSRRRTALWNVLGALVSPLGAIAALTISQANVQLEMPLLGLSAGMFIYIAAADLIPEIQRAKKLSTTIIQLFLLLLGILAIYGVGDFFPHG